MGSWVLLLRGVGGRTQINPRLLRAVLGAEGFGRVAVFGQSGNAVVTSPLPREEVAWLAIESCAREMGFRKDIHVIPGADWAELVTRNPFPEAVENPTTLHAAFLGADPDPARVAALNRLGDGSDALVVLGRMAYLHAPKGFARSRIATRFDRGIGVPTTARSWTAVQRLHSLVEVADLAEAA
ncbi:hypothetical protein Rumeso_04969 [Rubellimicrobium mesophilum DSM 19309]|uniref:DUF1697 domain-containing protein n=1 Tax=Rubellimicrobium mesophilum DSM 19309 TaxID=442562 RepID=A0A017HBS8_9RHOB|nr:DUF1697 domain-containing protein [Rubellimicrobium mesophilum]EYD71568.1 hypothetical protein Rumeso_04969 [Rubellimicrobium mesophilum DSM 19309]